MHHLLGSLQVLHIRNLPYETTEEELRELCSAFGPIVQTKLNVGANKNQAFVEFPELNMAINMVSYYANSADPAKVGEKISPDLLLISLDVCQATVCIVSFFGCLQHNDPVRTERIRCGSCGFAYKSCILQTCELFCLTALPIMPGAWEDSVPTIQH